MIVKEEMNYLTYLSNCYKINYDDVVSMYKHFGKLTELYLKTMIENNIDVKTYLLKMFG